MSNDIKLQEGHPVDENLRPIKVGGESTALELSKDKVRTKVLDAGELTASTFTPATLSVSGDATIGNDLTVGNDITCGNDFLITGGVIEFGSASDQIFKVTGQSTIRFVAGGAVMMNIMETTTGNHIEFYNSAVGFNQRDYGTLDATDTYLLFRESNKWTGTFPASNITDMHLIFPNVSGNFMLLLTQDGTGSRTVTNWKTWDETGAANESTVKWAGGSAPTLTTTANKTDILSFYWDNTNHKAYGVASLNF